MLHTWNTRDFCIRLLHQRLWLATTYSMEWYAGKKKWMILQLNNDGWCPHLYTPSNSKVPPPVTSRKNSISPLHHHYHSHNKSLEWSSFIGLGMMLPVLAFFGMKSGYRIATLTPPVTQKWDYGDASTGLIPISPLHHHSHNKSLEWSSYIGLGVMLLRS